MSVSIFILDQIKHFSSVSPFFPPIQRTGICSFPLPFNILQCRLKIIKNLPKIGLIYLWFQKESVEGEMGLDLSISEMMVSNWWHFLKEPFDLQCRRPRFDPWITKIPGGGNGNPVQYSCLENSKDRWSLEGYSPWGLKELDTTERLTHSLHLTLFL